MIIDMTNYGKPLTEKLPLSNFKVAYFRIPQWEKRDDTGLINDKPPVLEICLIPYDKDTETFDNNHGFQKDKQNEVAFAIPPEALIIKVRAGDQWPDIEEIKAAMEDKIRISKNIERRLSLKNDDEVVEGIIYE